MRLLFAVTCCLAVSSSLYGQTTPEKIRLTERVFEIDRVALATTPKTPG